MTRQLDLLAIGLTTLDVTVYPVESLPAPDTGQIVQSITLSPAGTAAGTAIIAQRLGMAAGIASAVGDDAQGGLVRSMLEAAGVDTGLLLTSPGMPTSTTVLPIRPDGERPNWHMLGASVFAGVTDDMREALGRTAAVHWGAVGFPGVAGAGADFLRLARERGVFTSCDLIAPGDAANIELDALLPHIDMFMPSMAEVRALAGTEDPAEGARHFMARGAGACLVKMGAKGALLVQADGAIHVPAFRIEPVDTTSCGDSLCAGYLAGRSRGLDAAAALRFAVAAAAQVALGVGTLGKLGGFEETLQFASATGESR